MEADKKFLNIMMTLSVAEAVVVYWGLNELILKIESEAEGKDAKLLEDTIRYINLVRERYKKIAKSPMTVDDEGNIIPVL